MMSTTNFGDVDTGWNTPAHLTQMEQMSLHAIGEGKHSDWELERFGLSVAA
jgi:hypothetical protein